MENNDPKLKELLQKWEAPAAPATLTRRVFPRQAWWRWLWSGSIRVPVPVGLAVLAAVVLGLYWSSRTVPQQVSAPEKPVSLADFRPVEQLEPRIIRSVSNEGN